MSHTLPPSRTLVASNHQHSSESPESSKEISPAIRSGSHSYTQGSRKPQNIFFNAEISISQLKVLGDIDIIDEEAEESSENNKN